MYIGIILFNDRIMFCVSPVTNVYHFLQSYKLSIYITSDWAAFWSITSNLESGSGDYTFLDRFPVLWSNMFFLYPIVL